MNDILQIALGIAILVFFVWLMIPPSKPVPDDSGAADAPFIDPDDSLQIGLLIGLRGGSIPDAAVMRFALQRFEQLHGRRATSRDIGTVLGLIESTD